MSRDAGFGVADRATRTLYDPLLVRAYRKAGLAAIVAWDAIVDASWAAGRRVCFDDAILPLPYDLGDEDALRAVMVDVGLLDADGFVRESSWEGWFGAARDRRSAARRGGVEGNRRRWHPDAPPAAASRGPIGGRSDTDPRPSGPSDRTPRAAAHAPAREESLSKPGTLRDTMAAMGLKTEVP